MKSTLPFILALVWMLPLALPAQEGGLLGPILDAHGGLDTWRQFGTLEWGWNSDGVEAPVTSTSTVHLYQRHEHLSTPDYEMGFDGQQYWIKTDNPEAADRDPRFFINLQFYFFAMPFVLADPGVNHERLGSKTIGGKTYEVIKATFDPGTGVAPEDQYILHIDPATQRLDILLYSVTYFDKDRATSYNALKYTWQQVQGLWVPQHITGFVWEADTYTLGEKRYDRFFPVVTFKKPVPDPAVFAMPAGAVKK